MLSGSSGRTLLRPGAQGAYARADTTVYCIGPFSEGSVRGAALLYLAWPGGETIRLVEAEVQIVDEFQQENLIGTLPIVYDSRASLSTVSTRSSDRR